MSSRQQVTAWVLTVTLAITAVVALVATGSEPYPPTPTPAPSVVMTDRGTERASRGDVRDVCNLRTCHQAPKSSHTPPRASAPRVAPVTTRVWSGGVWDRIAACESGGNWHARGGVFEGGLQFLPSTWAAAGGHRYARHAYDATREQQIRVARAWLARTSWAQWPVCSRNVGVR